MTIGPSKRLDESVKQGRLAVDQLNDRDDDLPEGVVDEIAECVERISRARHEVEKVIDE